MRSIAEEKAHRAAIVKKYQSKPEVKARHAERERARRDAERTIPKRKPPTPIAHLSEQEKRAHRAAQQRERMELKRARSPLVAKRSAQKKGEKRKAQLKALRAQKQQQPFFSRAGLSDQEKRARRAAQMREWYAAHKDIARIRAVVSHNRRRARANTTDGDFTRQEWQALCDRYNQQCACCKAHAPLTVDHVIPLIKGGTNDIGNLQPLCAVCNRRKGVKTTDYR